MRGTMVMASRSAGVVILVLVSLLGYGEALFGGKNGGGGGRTAGGGRAAAPKQTTQPLTPAIMEQVANKASESIMMWSTSAIFQLKQATLLKDQVERLRMAPGGVGPDGIRVKMDEPMYKQVVGGALGGVFLMLNSPGMGKVSEITASLMKDQKRQMRVIALDKKVRASFDRPDDGSNRQLQGPEGFLEGAMFNKEVADAHDKFMSDVEALANSGLAKKVASSAEAYHDVMLKYATSEQHSLKPPDAPP